MVRISLIIAIVAGIAALAISQLKVDAKIKALTSDLESTRQTLTTAQEAERKAKKEAKDATAAAEKAKKELETTKNDLLAASEHATLADPALLVEPRARGRILQDADLVHRALDKRLRRGPTVLRQDVLLQRAGVHSDADRNAAGFRLPGDQPDLVLVLDVAGVDA